MYRDSAVGKAFASDESYYPVVVREFERSEGGDLVQPLQIGEILRPIARFEAVEISAVNGLVPRKDLPDRIIIIGLDTDKMIVCVGIPAFRVVQIFQPRKRIGILCVPVDHRV